MNFAKSIQLTNLCIANACGEPILMTDPDRPVAPRYWSLCMTSENHGTVGKAGDQFTHAPGKHERVQVVEIVAVGSPPAPVVDLAGLARFGFCDINDDEFLERPDGAYFLAHEVEARCASASPVAAQAGLIAAPEEALRVVRRLLDGSQPKDLAGAIMVIDSALNGGAAWTYEIEPPAGFADYVQANYSGDVSFHDPAWHARRLWNAAMRNLSKSSSGSAQASTSGERQEGGA